MEFQSLDFALTILNFFNESFRQTVAKFTVGQYFQSSIAIAWLLSYYAATIFGTNHTLVIRSADIYM